MWGVSEFPVGLKLISVIMPSIFIYSYPMLYPLLKMGEECDSICFMTFPFAKYYVHTFQILAPYFADEAEVTYCKF